MKEHYDYCILNSRKDKVVLFDHDKSSDVYPVEDEVILNVKVSFDEHNNLILEGEPLIYNIAMERTKVDELEHKPCKKFIKHYEPGKLARWFGEKPYDYVYGWWAYRKKVTIKHILNKYRIDLL